MYRANVVICGALLAIATSLPAAAEPPSDTPPKAPLEQASESVDKNLQKHPDNRGLQNAAGRIADNQERIAERRAARTNAGRPVPSPARPGRGVGRR